MGHLQEVTHRRHPATQSVAQPGSARICPPFGGLREAALRRADQLQSVLSSSGGRPPASLNIVKVAWMSFKIWAYSLGYSPQRALAEQQLPLGSGAVGLEGLPRGQGASRRDVVQLRRGEVRGVQRWDGGGHRGLGCHATGEGVTGQARVVTCGPTQRATLPGWHVS